MRVSRSSKAATLLAAVVATFRRTSDFPTNYQLERELVTKQIEELLWEVGGDLVVRLGHRIAPTAKGLWLAPGADDERRLLQQWLDELRDLRDRAPETILHIPLTGESSALPRPPALLVVRVLSEVDLDLKYVEPTPGNEARQFFGQRRVPQLTFRSARAQRARSERLSEKPLAVAPGAAQRRDDVDNAPFPPIANSADLELS